MTAVRITSAGPNDVAAVAGFIATLWRAHGEPEPLDIVTTARAEAILADHDAVFLEVAGRRVGYVAFEDLGDRVLIRHFVLDPRDRGRGLGRRAFAALAARLPGRRIALHVSDRLPGPRAFWKAVGFTRRGDVMEREPESAERRAGPPARGAPEPGFGPAGKPGSGAAPAHR